MLQFLPLADGLHVGDCVNLLALCHFPFRAGINARCSRCQAYCAVLGTAVEPTVPINMSRTLQPYDIWGILIKEPPGACVTAAAFGGQANRWKIAGKFGIGRYAIQPDIAAAGAQAFQGKSRHSFVVGGAYQLPFGACIDPICAGRQPDGAVFGMAIQPTRAFGGPEASERNNVAADKDRIGQGNPSKDFAGTIDAPDIAPAYQGAIRLL